MTDNSRAFCYALALVIFIGLLSGCASTPVAPPAALKCEIPAPPPELLVVPPPLPPIPVDLPTAVKR